jgi:hypothetical protein
MNLNQFLDEVFQCMTGDKLDGFSILEVPTLLSPMDVSFEGAFLCSESCLWLLSTAQKIGLGLSLVVKACIE